MYDLIKKKRNGEAFTQAEIQYFVKGFVAGEIKDYQASALMMATFFQGMSDDETFSLTKAMIHSGDTIDLSGIKGIKVDKHSTGGVGDKTSLVLGPLVAAAGVPFAKLSGRGLGHTGGTIDKLESISGFSVEMSEDTFINNVNTIGIAIGGQTANLVPADKKLYALRDVTATVDIIPMIASSIMSKKVASGADAIVLDVKTGSGAYMKKESQAVELAKRMVAIGKRFGRNTMAVISNMDQPLGNAVGNSLEVIEAINTLKGKGPKDLRELCLVLGSKMMVLSGLAESLEEGRSKLEGYIASGAAFDKFKAFVEAQGGDRREVEDISLLPQAAYTEDVLSPVEGYIERLQALPVGMASMELGAGRATKESSIDLAAGIYLHHKIGAYVKKGEPIASLYTNTKEAIPEAKKQLLSAYTFSATKPDTPPLIFTTV